MVVWEKTMDEPQRTTQFPWVPGDRGSRWVDVCTTDSDQGSMSGCCNQWKQYEFRNSGSCTADCLSITRKDFLKKLMQQHRKNQCFEIWGGAWFAKLVMQKKWNASIKPSHLQFWQCNYETSTHNSIIWQPYQTQNIKINFHNGSNRAY